jgi:hypothetical protein
MTDAKHTTGGALVLDGSALRDRMIADVAREVADLSSVPCLATVLIGDDGPSQVYVRNKHRQAQLAGMTSRNETLPASATQYEAEQLVRTLADDPSVSGILVQQPVPAHLDGEKLLALIPVDKDVDGLTTASMGRLLRGIDSLVPCTPLGVLRLLQHYGAPTAGKRAVVVGRRFAIVGVAGPKGNRCNGHVGAQSHHRLGGGMPGGRHSGLGNGSGSQYWSCTRKAGSMGDRCWHLTRREGHRRRCGL